MSPNKSTKRKRATAQSSAAVDTPRVPSTPTTPISEAFAVKCSRKSELTDIDEDMYIDLWGDEEDDATTTAEDNAKGFDGSWVWDSDPRKSGCQCYDYRKKVDDEEKSFLGGGGVPVVFKDRAAAEAAAFSVWQAMLLAQDRLRMPLLQQLQEQARSKPGSVKEVKGEAAAAAAAADFDAAVSVGDQQLLSRFRTVSADGLSAWQADVEYWDDPYMCGEDAKIKNEVTTTVRVEVIKASIV